MIEFLYKFHQIPLKYISGYIEYNHGLFLEFSAFQFLKYSIRIILIWNTVEYTKSLNRIYLLNTNFNISKFISRGNTTSEMLLHVTIWIFLIKKKFFYFIVTPAACGNFQGLKPTPLWSPKPLKSDSLPIAPQWKLPGHEFFFSSKNLRLPLGSILES